MSNARLQAAPGLIIPTAINKLYHTTDLGKDLKTIWIWILACLALGVTVISQTLLFGFFGATVFWGLDVCSGCSGVSCRALLLTPQVLWLRWAWVSSLQGRGLQVSGAARGLGSQTETMAEGLLAASASLTPVVDTWTCPVSFLSSMKWG